MVSQRARAMGVANHSCATSRQGTTHGALDAPVDWDGDGDVAEGIADEITTIHEQLLTELSRSERRRLSST